MTSMIYEIRVDGRLPKHSGEGFCGLQLEEVPMGLILRGPVIDESHLLGIISEFRRLGMSVVSVRPSSRSDRGGGPADQPVPGTSVVTPLGAPAPPSRALRSSTTTAIALVTECSAAASTANRCRVDHDDVDVVAECSTDVDHLAGDPGRKPATDQHDERTTTRRCDPQSLDTVGCGPVLRLPCFRSPDRHRRPRSRSGAARRRGSIAPPRSLAIRRRRCLIRWR